MEILKRVEIGFRFFLVKGLGLFVRRKRALPGSIDFSSKKFLFVRQDRIGDVLVSTPLAYALKSRYPNATVDFLLSSNNHFVLENESLVRKRWVYRKTALSALEIVRSIRRERYDFVIDLMDNPSATSTVLCILAGGKWNVGLSKENEYAYDIVVPLLSRKDTHIVDRLAMLLKVFGVDPESVDLKIRYNVLQENREYAARFFGQERLRGQQVIGINISPGEGARFWGIENYQGLIRRLRGEFPQYPLLIMYQPADRSVAQETVQPFSDVMLSPETQTFDQFAALVQQLWALVTPDTSAVHLAAAFSIPSVVMYVQSNKELRIWEPYGSVSETLVTDVDDLRTIPLEKVFQAIVRIIQKAHTDPDKVRQTVVPTI